MAPVILVFAKAPVPGRVKTRLQPVLSAEAAAALHCSFVGDVLERVKGFKPEVDVILYLDHDTDVFGDVPRRLQRGGDLGAKMWNAAAEQFATGRAQVLLIGTDSPDLPASHLRQLLASEADVAFGPAEDGGYYAVMFRKLPPGLFDGVRWSSEHALADSIAAAERCGLRVGLGDKWYDIDEPADLERLAGASELPRRTRAWLEAHQFLSKRA